MFWVILFFSNFFGRSRISRDGAENPVHQKNRDIQKAILIVKTWMDI
jgi:hypothetical protein